MFTQFPPESRAFLAGIAEHNDKTWFDANRPLYEAGFVAAGKAMVEALGPQLAALAPGISYAPRVNGSIMRINRDVRFSKDKRPYKSHLDLWFWHGEARNMSAPGFWFRLTKDEVMLGCGVFMFDKEELDGFRQAVIHPRSGRALLAAVAEVSAAGPYVFGEKTRKLPPRGMSTDPDRAEYLLYEGLNAGITLPVDTAYSPGFPELCLAHYRATWPIGRWLVAEVFGGGAPVAAAG